MSITYLDERLITAARESHIPAWATGADRTGYGRKIRTSWELRINKRWHRIYVVCYSNAGSSYVLIAGKPHYLMSSYRPADTFLRSNRESL